jgi:chemotaxis protein methyltransferase CheR
VAITRHEFDYIRHVVREQSALVLEPGKEYLVESRLQILANREGVASIQDLVRRLRSDSSGKLQRKLVDAMITAETSFFRDVRPFEGLKKIVLPEVLDRRASHRSLNLWCAASAAGQEPYSIAMLLLESFPLLSSWSVRFMASDLSRDLLARAREGKYSQLEVNRGLPAALLVKYFRKVGRDWQIHDRVRNMVEFAEINLAKPWPSLPSMDIIFMRNVLIYFDEETRKNILGRVRNLLRPDGHLFLGGSETTINLDEAFEPVTADATLCFRVR